MVRAVLSILFFASLVALASCRDPVVPQLTEEDIDFLTADAHVLIGDVVLTAPFATLRNQVSMDRYFQGGTKVNWPERRDAFRSLASYSEEMPTFDRLTFEVDAYGYSHPGSASPEDICSRLKRDWAKSVCNDPWAPLLQALPPNKRFYLADDRKLEVFDHASTVGKERYSDHLRAMNLQRGAAAIVCDREPPSYCTAAILIERHLIAVWTVWNGEQETAVQQASREGKAIVAFTHLALQTPEDLDELTKVSCELRRPGSVPGPESIPYACGG